MILARLRLQKKPGIFFAHNCQLRGKQTMHYYVIDMDALFD